MRYELATEFKEKNDLAQGFDIQTLQLTAPGAQIYAADANDFGPRVGLTYDLFANGKTILGGGYGIYYQPYPLQSYFGDTIFSNIVASTTLTQSTTPGLSYPLPPLAGGVAPPPNRTAIDPEPPHQPQSPVHGESAAATRRTGVVPRCLRGQSDVQQSSKQAGQPDRSRAGPAAGHALRAVHNPHV